MWTEKNACSAVVEWNNLCPQGLLGSQLYWSPLFLFWFSVWWSIDLLIVKSGFLKSWIPLLPSCVCLFSSLDCFLCLGVLTLYSCKLMVADCCSVGFFVIIKSFLFELSIFSCFLTSCPYASCFDIALYYTWKAVMFHQKLKWTNSIMLQNIQRIYKNLSI